MFNKIKKDVRGTSILLFSLSVAMFTLFVFALEFDLQKVVLTKITLSSISDIAAREATKAFDTEYYQSTGIKKIDPIKAKDKVSEVFFRHEGLLAEKIKNIDIKINQLEVEVVPTIDIKLSNFLGMTTIKSRGKARTEGF